MLIEALDPTLRFYQFGVKKPIPDSQGKTVVWNKDVRLDLGLALTEGNPVELSTAFALSTRKVSGIARQWGGWVSFSDFVDVAAIHDVMKQAYQRIGRQAGETVERVIVAENFTDNKAIQGKGDSCCYLFKTSTELTEYVSNALYKFSLINGENLKIAIKQFMATLKNLISLRAIGEGAIGTCRD